MNQVKILREAKNLTQTELAERSGISLRTVQRIEAGSPLKGFTLNAIAEALECNPSDLFPKQKSVPDLERAKLINFSALAGLIIPFGGIIFPLFLTVKTKDEINKQIGKNVVCQQIILTVILSISLICIPFIQKNFEKKTPLILYAIIIFMLLKVLIVILNGISLNKTNNIYKYLKINFL